MSTHNIGFYKEISQIVSEISSNVHFICSSGVFVRSKAQIVGFVAQQLK